MRNIGTFLSNLVKITDFSSYAFMHYDIDDQSFSKLRTICYIFWLIFMIT